MKKLLYVFILLGFLTAGTAMGAQSLSVPQKLAPPDNSSNLPLTVTFSWKSVEGAASYWLQVWYDTAAGGRYYVEGEDEFDVVYARTSKTVNLPYETTYYWNVQACYAAGNCTSGWGETWTFNTFQEEIGETVSTPSSGGKEWVRVDYPNGGEVLYVGSFQSIRWGCEAIDEVWIALYKGGSQIRKITGSTPANCPQGGYSWTVPSDITPGDDYRIMVADQDWGVDQADWSDRYFTISGQTPTPSEPSSGEPSSGEPTSGEPSSGQPTPTQPSSGRTGGTGIIDLRELNPLQAESVQELIGKISWFVWRLAIAIAPIMFIIAGFLWITSAGEPGRVRTAKNMFLYTAIGLAIVLLASGLYEVLKSILGG
jgi:hypothetical protein